MARKVELGLTDAELARALGVTHQVIYAWKHRGSIPAKHLAKLAQVLKVTTDWIQTGKAALGVDIKLLTEILCSVAEIEHDSWPMDPSQKAELVALLYDDAARDPGMATHDRIQRIVKMLRNS